VQKQVGRELTTGVLSGVGKETRYRRVARGVSMGGGVVIKKRSLKKRKK